ncbi:MAG TPA: NAD-dependent epimerase/dehydratase family protein [Candidatus Angelobacter sp.]|nr:NAD-dependent epimerase/dehydratase family protein [Candidatus Angelobacter sp.]
MYDNLVIGATGFIGGNLAKHLPKIGTGLWTRNDFDMLTKTGFLPQAHIIYLCAGVNGTLTCSTNPQETYRVNVDGTIYITEHYRIWGGFVVWISSTTVEWLSEDYGAQKRTTEQYLRQMPNVAIVRAGRVDNSNVADLCTTMIDLGQKQRKTLVLWNENEQPYKK